MSYPNQIGILKEQLRIKSLELRKKDVEKAKQENRAQHVIEISRKKISDLKKEFADKEKSIRASLWDDSFSVQTKEKQSESFLEPNIDSLNEGKISKAIHTLKQKNILLTDQIKAENLYREKFARESARLLDETKRLQVNSNKSDKFKKQLFEAEQKCQNFARQYKSLLQEKRHLVAEFQEIQADRKNIINEEHNANKNNRELKKKLDFLNDEKGGLQLALENNKKLFDIKLAEDIKELEDQWEGKTKALRKKKDRGKHFAEQAMDDGESPMWLITYSDMATLLLTFFILYYSIAAQNLGKFKEAILEESEQNLGLLELIDKTKIKTSLQNFTGFKSNNIFNDINNFATDENNLGITQNNSKIVIRIPGRSLFQSASAVLEKRGWPLLTEAAGIFKKYPNYKIHIQGHTDDNSISTEKFPTNWELSATRATAVLRFFMDKGLDPGRLTATGYADTFPLVPNTTPEGRASNRRVEFVLEKITQ